MTEILIAFINLMEAEGRALRRGSQRVFGGLVLTGLGGLLGALGLGLILWALFRGVAGPWGITGAALVTGGAALLLAGFIAWIAIRIAR